MKNRIIAMIRWLLIFDPLPLRSGLVEGQAVCNFLPEKPVEKARCIVFELTSRLFFGTAALPYGQWQA